MKSITLTTIAAALLLASAAAQADVSISGRPTKNITCSAGACVPDGPKAVLNVKDLEALLANSDTTVFTGNGAVSIHVKVPLSWSGTHKLTLNAFRSVYFEAPVTAEGTSAVSLVTNTQGLGGTVYFRPGGSLSFWDLNSQLSIDGTAYTLFTDLTTLADDIAANPAGNFALAQDFDAFADGIFPHSVVTTTYQGSLEGLGHTLDHLSINDSNPNDQLVGLFSRLDVGSRVANLHLTSESVVSADATTAGVAGAGLGTLDHVWVEGNIEGGWYDVGVVGVNSGSITRAVAAVTLSGVVCGGITGFNDGGAISLSTASGSCEGEAGGGLVGINQGSISQSSASASVSSGYIHAQIGGLVGQHESGTIDQSFATGSVTLESQNRRSHGMSRPAKDVGATAGGLVGVASAPITNSYATGNVNSSPNTRNAVGGLIGILNLNSSSTAKGAYSVGPINAQPETYIGGSIGYDENAIRNKARIYWNLDTSGVPDISKGAGNIAFDPGLEGITDDQLKKRLPKGFDRTIWAHDAAINNGYPYLLANPPPK